MVFNLRLQKAIGREQHRISKRDGAYQPFTQADAQFALDFETPELARHCVAPHTCAGFLGAAGHATPEGIY